jgi:hypothetical protein
MTSTTGTYVPWDVHQPRGKSPWCAHCDTDVHLVVEFPAVGGRRSGTLAVAVHRSQCNFSRVMDTTAAHVAPFRCSDQNSSRPKEYPMTIASNTTTPVDGTAGAASIEDLDLTPAGLADAPASEQDRESLVHTGNS